MAILKDLQYGLRTLVKNPGYAAVAVLTLGLGIGFNSAIFSLVNAVILRPLPYPYSGTTGGAGPMAQPAGPRLCSDRRFRTEHSGYCESGVFQYVAYYRWSGFNITEGSRPESVQGIKASAELLPVFGIAPQLGRYFSREDTEAGRDQVAVIGHRLWQMRYGSDPAILGKTVDLDQRRYTIVGVMPASFRFTWDQEIDVFVPLVLTAEERSELGAAPLRDSANAGATEGGRKRCTGASGAGPASWKSGATISGSGQRLGLQSGASS